MERIDLRESRNTLSELAYQHVLNSILSHKLRPGQHLRPEEMADAMGISPTPVKHALARLSGEGLVQFRGAQGPFVISPSDQELVELFDARMMCEIRALQEGIHQVDSTFTARAENLATRCNALLSATGQDTDARRAAGSADTAFHLHFMSLWPNQKVLAWYRQIDIQVRACVMIETGWPGAFRREWIPSEHRALCEAANRHDLAAAIDIVCRHLNAAKETLLELRHSGATSQEGSDGIFHEADPRVL